MEDILERGRELGIIFDRKLDRPFKLQQLLYDACYQRACMEEQFLDTLIQGMMIEKIEEEIDDRVEEDQMAKIVFKRCSLTLDLETIERCKRLAAEKGQSVSSLVRYLVAEACEHATAAKRREVTGEGR